MIFGVPDTFGITWEPVPPFPLLLAAGSVAATSTLMSTYQVEQSRKCSFGALLAKIFDSAGH